MIPIKLYSLFAQIRSNIETDVNRRREYVKNFTTGKRHNEVASPSSFAANRFPFDLILQLSVA